MLVSTDVRRSGPCGIRAGQWYPQGVGAFRKGLMKENCFPVRIVFNPSFVNFLERLKEPFASKARPEHLRHGEWGERAAEKHLQKLGIKFLTANFHSGRCEIDLVFHNKDCLCFVEVKTRSCEDSTRTAAAVNARKRPLLSQTALDSLKRLKNPPVGIRISIVEVLLADDSVREIRHLPNIFPTARPYRMVVVN